MLTTIILVVASWALGLGILFVLIRSRLLRGRLRERIQPAATDRDRADENESFLANWLRKAGYRKPQAPTVFVVACVLAAVVSGILILLIFRSGIINNGRRSLLGMPGNIGEVFVPLLIAAPWIIGFVALAFPWLIVRSQRREYVTQIEQDLPLFLELLATLSEAGLGLDAAIERVLRSQPVDRPLAREFRQLQRDVLAGRGRVASLRRLTKRTDVNSLTVFVSALVQAEQVGSGVAAVLRRQADDLRDRRRERAIALAMALPVKLLFPLVICFLPGLFVATLGPTFYQFFQFADSVIQNRGLK